MRFCQTPPHARAKHRDGNQMMELDRVTMGYLIGFITGELLGFFFVLKIGADVDSWVVCILLVVLPLVMGACGALEADKRARHL